MAPDPIRVTSGKSTTITWKIVSPGWEFASNGIELLSGTGSLVGRNEVKIQSEHASETVEADFIMIATGTSPARPAPRAGSAISPAPRGGAAGGGSPSRRPRVPLCWTAGACSAGA